MRPRIAFIAADRTMIAWTIRRLPRPRCELSAAGFRLRDVTLYLVNVSAINGANQIAPAIVDVNLRD
jgi:hypothetical protein